MLFRAFICKQNDFSCRGEFCAGFAARSGEGVEGTTVPGQGVGEEKSSTALVETPAPGAGCARGREQWDVLLSPLSLLSSVRRDFAATFIHRKAVFGVCRDECGKVELLWKGGRGGGGGGWREMLPGMCWALLGS